MARKKAEPPAYRRHAQSGRGYVFVDGKQHMLPGRFGSEDSLSAYRELIAKWAASGGRLPEPRRSERLTIADLAADYLEHCEVYYRRKDGTPTGAVDNVRDALRDLLALHGSRCARAFGIAELKLLREHMIRRRLARSTINKRTGIIVRMFAWGVEEQQVPAEVFGALRAVRPLKRGRTRAKETEPVRPVEWADVAATLPSLSPTLRALVLFLWHTAARVGEAVQLRTRDVDMAGKVWLFQPEQHKLLHRDKPRVIAIGAEAQAIVRSLVKLDPDAYWFRPEDAVSDQMQARRAARATPLWPSHADRYERERAAREPRKLGDRYTTLAVGVAIRRACRAAGVTPWSPHRLRHAALTRIRREHGIEAAAAVAGHSAITMTDRYSHEAQKQLAVRVAEGCG